MFGSRTSIVIYGGEKTEKSFENINAKEVKNLAKAKALLLAALTVMAVGMSADTYAAVPQNTSYDFYVNVENVKNWRVSNYDDSVNVPKVTVEEARFGGYDADNVPASNITEEEWEALLSGNGNDADDSSDS